MKKDVPQEGFFFDDSRHFYYFDGKKMTGVTTILGVLAKPALIPWAARMAADHIGDNLEALIAGTPEERKAILDAAKNAHTKKKEAGADKGTDAHALVEAYVKDCITFHEGRVAVGFTAYKAITPFIEWAAKNNIKFLASEKKFYSKTLFVAGTADLLFEKDGKRYVGDVKTFKKLWDRTPMFQAAGYALLAEEMGEPKFDGYCVLRLSEDGSFEEKWSYDVEGDTRAFKACVELYRQLSQWNK